MLLKRGKPEAIEIASMLSVWLHAHGHEALLIDDQQPPPPGIRGVTEAALWPEELELLVVLGGDGTLLHGAALVADERVPILGVNLGHLGFLTSCAPADAEGAVQRALAGQLPLEERLRLQCTLVRGDGVKTTHFA